MEFKKMIILVLGLLFIFGIAYALPWKSVMTDMATWLTNVTGTLFVSGNVNVNQSLFVTGNVTMNSSLILANANGTNSLVLQNNASNCFLYVNGSGAMIVECSPVAGVGGPGPLPAWNYLLKAGDSMTGNLNMTSNNITDIANAYIIDAWIENLHGGSDINLESNLDGTGYTITANSFTGSLVGNANSATTWDGETSQADLNVNNTNYLDGLDGYQFLRSDANDILYGNLIISGNLSVLGFLENATITDVAANGSIVPDYPAVFDLGSAVNSWLNLYVINLMATNLESNLDGTGYNITADNFNGKLSALNVEGAVWVNKTGDSMTGNLNMGNNNISNIFNLTASFIDGVLTWTNLTGYPPVCPVGNAVTMIADSPICTRFVLANGDTMTGKLNMSNNNITDVSDLYVTNLHGGSPIQVWDMLNMTNNNITMSAGGIILKEGYGLSYSTPGGIQPIFYFNGGNVYITYGFNTTFLASGIPVVTIDSSGNITANKLETNYIMANQGFKPPQTAMTCGPPSEGTIYYNVTTKLFYGCNSTSWNVLG